MALCVACSYKMVEVANGNLNNVTFKRSKESQDIMKKQELSLKEGEIPVGCYVCPECGHCAWLET